MNSLKSYPSLHVCLQRELQEAILERVFNSFRSSSPQELRDFVQTFVTSVQKTQFVRETGIMNKLCWLFSKHKLLCCVNQPWESH